MRQTRRPLVSADVLNDPLFAPVQDVLRARGTVSLLIAPLVVGDEVIGTLGLDSTVPRVFTEAECEIAETISNQVSVAIVKAQLYAAERDERFFSDALRDTAAAVNSSLNIDDVLDRILDYIGRVMPHDAANIMLIEDGMARVVRGHGYTEQGVGAWLNQLRFVVAEVPTWHQMMASGQPFAINDTHKDPNWLKLVEEQWIRSTVKAPIRVEGQIIGILHLDSATPDTFTQAHAERLQAFADQAAIAIQNAQLFDHVQRHAAELEQRVEQRTEELERQRAQLQAILDSMRRGGHLR